MSDAPTPSREAPDVLDTPHAGGLAIRGGLLRIMAYVGGTLVALVSVPLLVRHLGVEEFGRYITVVSLIAIVAGVTEGGLSSVAVREYAALGGSRRRVFMRDILGARVALTTAGLIGALAFAQLAAYRRDMVVGAALAGVGLLLAVVQSTYVVPLTARLRMGWIALGDLLRAVIASALVVAGVLAGAGIVPFLAIPIASSLVLLILTVALVRGDVPLRPAFHPSRWWRVLRATLPLAVASAIGTLYFRMAIIVMSLVATAVQTGYFATSYRLIEALAGIPLMLVGVTFPILARAARDDAERLAFAVQRVFEIGLIGGAWMTIATALGAGFAMQVIGGNQVERAANVLEVQALYLTPLFLNLTWQYALLALRMHREMLIAAVVALATMGVLTLALIPPFEARGAAVAVVIGETVLALAEGALLWRAHAYLRPNLRVAPRVALATALAVGAALAADASDAVQVLVATMVYVAALVVLRAVPKELGPALLRRASQGAS
jgi:O-antigen/teichoic acid export membrane protein